jgi:hypothetical protein
MTQHSPRGARHLVIALTVLLGACDGDAAHESGGTETPTVATHRTEIVDTLLHTSETNRAELQVRPADGIVATEKGVTYLLDAGSASILRINPSGDSIRSVGQPGEGPGDLGDPCCLGFVGTSSALLIYEEANRRYSTFDEGLTFVGSVGVKWNRLGSIGSVQLANRHILHPRIAFTGLADPNHPQLLWLDSSGTVVDSELVRLPSPMIPVRAHFDIGKGTGMMLEQPFGGTLRYAVSRNGDFAVANSATYLILLRKPDGSIAELRGPAMEGAAVTSDERQKMHDRLEKGLKQFGKRVSDLPFPIPEHHAPLKAVFFDADARLWVRYRRSSDAEDMSDIYAPTGEKLWSVRVPTSLVLAPMSIRGFDGLGVATDESGFASVIRLRFVPLATTP